MTEVTDSVMDLFIARTISCLEHMRVVRFGYAESRYEMDDGNIRFVFYARVKFYGNKNTDKAKNRRWWTWGREHSDDENMIVDDKVASDLIEAARSCLRHARVAQF